MKTFLVSILCLAALSVASAQSSLTTVQKRASERQATGSNAVQTLSDLPILSRGMIGLDNTTTIAPTLTGQGLIVADTGWTYTSTLNYTKPTAARTLTVPDASGTLLLTGSSGQAVTAPVITGGLTASGSATNDFSGSTGAFNTSTGAVTLEGATTALSSVKSSSPTAGIGYTTGSGGTVTQLTSRATGVTLNTVTGQITLFAAAGSTTPASFTVTDSAVAATDVVIVNAASGTNIYEALVTAVAAGSFRITFYTTTGTTSDSPVFNFAVVKGSAN